MRADGPPWARSARPEPVRARGASLRVRRPDGLEEHHRGDGSGQECADQLKAFGRLEYPTVPLGVSDEFRNRLLTKALRERHASAWEGQP